MLDRAPVECSIGEGCPGRVLNRRCCSSFGASAHPPGQTEAASAAACRGKGAGRPPQQAQHDQQAPTVLVMQAKAIVPFQLLPGLAAALNLHCLADHPLAPL
ncbi:hypothetical protein ABPG75_011015 [Micractinium tetrahymenae]